MQTLLLDQATWDLTGDVYGNIAVASEPYALAQDAASQCQLFKGELWYNTTMGVPYWQLILGAAPPLSLIKAELVAAAELVPGVIAAQCFISSVVNRQVQGQVQILDSSGSVIAASFFRGDGGSQSLTGDQVVVPPQNPPDGQSLQLNSGGPVLLNSGGELVL